jgi:putative transcriptional regulator
MINKKTLAMNQPQIGQFISELRLLTGLSQEKFAAQLGFTWGTVNRWENGRNKPSPIAIAQLEKMLLDMGDRGSELLVKYSAN